MSQDKGLDRPHDVRAGEELDIDAVDAWLKPILPNLGRCQHVAQFSGGASNWTYALDYPEMSVVLRRAPSGTKAKGAHDMAREFHLQQALSSSFNKVPQMLALCQDAEVLGTDFYLMEKLTGIIPRKNLPKSVKLSVEQTRQLCFNMLDTLIALHQVDCEAAGLNHLGKGQGFIQRQLDGWCKRYRQAKTWNVPAAENVMHWLYENKPDTETICLTHNDFRFDNLVLDVQDPTQINAVLDWELATLGDPLMDLGNTLAYWTEQNDDWFAQQIRRQPTHLPGMLSREEAIAYYTEKTGHSRQDMTFYQVFGLFRLVGIVQQIYYRYHHKQTRNPAFKQFWLVVHYLLWRCRKLIKDA